MGRIGFCKVGEQVGDWSAVRSTLASRGLIQPGAFGNLADS